MEKTEIYLPYLSFKNNEPKHLKVSLTRKQFEELTSDLVKRTIGPMEMCLRDSGLGRQDINEVLMVGGSTRIPKVGKTLEDFFGRKVNRGINPDEAVALGAAIQGAVLGGSVKDVVLIDVTPLTLGSKLHDGSFDRYIEKNTSIPAQKSLERTTAVDSQTSITIGVYQGEHPMADYNKFLGSFNLSGIPVAKSGVPKINITFNLDANGMLSVTAKDQGTGKANNITI